MVAGRPQALVVGKDDGEALADGLTGQQLALDVPLPGATVGGTVAVNVSGPRRMLYGTVRDLLIGITVVRAARSSRTSRGTTWASFSPAPTARSG